jgi:RNA polymerase sigma-70 factor (ECF subfamily)
LDHEASDEVLMLRYQRGDRDAFGALVRRYQVRVYNFVLRYLRSKAQAEDTAQDVFMRVVQRAGEFKHEARFSTWLFTIARNSCIDQQRKAALRQHPSLDQTPSNDTNGAPLIEQLADKHHRSSVERTVLDSEVAGSILAAIEELPDDQREVFLLREVAGLSFKDISEVTGAGENTLKSRMRYALERLQAKLSEFEEYARALR